MLSLPSSTPKTQGKGLQRKSPHKRVFLCFLPEFQVCKDGDFPQKMLQIWAENSGLVD